MFNFFDMVGNYEQRKVANFTKDELVIDTASVTDGDHPYETGILHPEYNDGDWIIVEAYDSKEDAQRGHDDWVKIMTAKELPDELRDCVNAGIGKLSESIGNNVTFKRAIKED